MSELIQKQGIQQNTENSFCVTCNGMEPIFNRYFDVELCWF
jgi:nitrate/TMAO reductase-like tetraheme cytochrome c subunit